MSSLELFMLIAGVFWCCIVPFCVLVCVLDSFAPKLRELLEDIICERRERKQAEANND